MPINAPTHKFKPSCCSNFCHGLSHALKRNSRQLLQSTDWRLRQKDYLFSFPPSTDFLCQMLAKYKARCKSLASMQHELKRTVVCLHSKCLPFFSCSARLADISVSSFSKCVFLILVSFQLHTPIMDGKYLKQSPLFLMQATQGRRG